MNTVYYGDKLKILRDYIKDESVDLIYLDPPFNSNRNYNVLFKDESGTEMRMRLALLTCSYCAGGLSFGERLAEDNST